MSDVLLIGTAVPEVRLLRDGLDAEWVGAPDPLDPGDIGDMASWPWAARLDSWQTEASTGPSHPNVVVAIWDGDLPAPMALASIDDTAWFERCETAFARWFAAMGVATSRCADAGSIVAVIERPSPLDCAGRAIETALGEAVGATVRSLARSEGDREVRVNAVTTPTRTAPEHVVAPAPSLARYPGSIEVDVLGAVQLMLDDRGAGVTGSLLDADDGRSWR